jgi:hypothetical protein
MWKSGASAPRQVPKYVRALAPAGYHTLTATRTRVPPHVAVFDVWASRTQAQRFASATTACHPEEAESLAKRATPDEGPMHLVGSTAAADKSRGPSARKERGPQDDNNVFRSLAKAGERLAEIHVHYEQQPEYKLTKVEKKGEKLDYGVIKMKLSKDKTTLIYNQFLTLSGIPKETYDYRLGNRSALEWVTDQYQVSKDKRSGITNDPNRADDPQYILRLIGQVITVSLETVKTVRSLPPLGLPRYVLVHQDFHSPLVTSDLAPTPKSRDHSAAETLGRPGNRTHPRS